MRCRPDLNLNFNDVRVEHVASTLCFVTIEINVKYWNRWTFACLFAVIVVGSFECLITSFFKIKAEEFPGGEKRCWFPSHNFQIACTTESLRNLESLRTFNAIQLIFFFVSSRDSSLRRKIKDRWPLNNDQVEDKRHENKTKNILQNIRSPTSRSSFHCSVFIQLPFSPSTVASAVKAAKVAKAKNRLKCAAFDFLRWKKQGKEIFCHGPRHQVLLLIQSISATRIQFKIARYKWDGIGY